MDLGFLTSNNGFLVEMIRVIPSAMWAMFLFVLLLMFYKPVTEHILPRIAGLKAMGMELQLVRNYIDDALDLAEKHENWTANVPAADKTIAVNRARRLAHHCSGVKALWVDDNPDFTLNERRMFEKLGMTIDISVATEDALSSLRIKNYDLVLSDMDRDSDNSAGLSFLKRLRESDEHTPVIFYVGNFDPDRGTPPHSFGITHRPDHLLHLVLDCVERVRT